MTKREKGEEGGKEQEKREVREWNIKGKRRTQRREKSRRGK